MQPLVPLHFRQARFDRASEHRADHAELAIQFVEVAVGFDAGVVFGYAGTAVDAGGAGVARAGIDPVHYTVA